MRQEGSGASVTLDAADRAGIAALRTALVSAEYDVAHVRPMLRGEGDAVAPRPADVSIIVRLLPERGRFTTLMRLFMLGLEASSDDARAALAPLSIEGAMRLGVLRSAANGVVGTVHIMPTGSYLFASDRVPEDWRGIRPDHVMGVASSSNLLASLVVPRPVERAVDIGCGCGVQAVLAARYARTVIACDINPRALSFTAFNAELNGARNVECRAGSFFEPVAGETFDLIVSNPPFVISPDNAIAFRDAGLGGDDVSRQVVRQSVMHLREGGLAFVLINWGIGDHGQWPDRLRGWTADLPCDAWYLHHSSEAPLFYAASWNSPLESLSSEYTAAIDRWSAYLTDLGFAGVGYGAAILRRRSGVANWVRFDDLRGQSEPASGDQVARLIANQDLLAGLADERALLDARLALDPDHRLDQVLRWHDGSAEVEANALRHETGFRFAMPVDTFTMELIARLDGHTLREAAHAAAAEHVATKAVDRAELEAEALRFAKMSLGLGFTHVVDGGHR